MSATIDLSEAPERRRWWLPVLAWTGALLLYALMLRVQIGLPFSLRAAKRDRLRLHARAADDSGAAVVAPGCWMCPVRPQPSPSRTSVSAVFVLAIWFGDPDGFHRWTIGPFFWQLVYAESWLFQFADRERWRTRAALGAHPGFSGVGA